MNLCEMRIQRVYAGDVIRMNMSQQNLAGLSAGRNQIIDGPGQRRLFVFIG